MTTEPQKPADRFAVDELFDVMFPHIPKPVTPEPEKQKCAK